MLFMFLLYFRCLIRLNMQCRVQSVLLCFVLGGEIQFTKT